MRAPPLNVEPRIRSMKIGAVKWVLVGFCFMGLLWYASRVAMPFGWWFKLLADWIIVAEALMLWLHINVVLSAVELLCALGWALKRDDRDKLTEDIGRVSPKAHWRERVLLRDPWPLYSTEVQLLVTEGKLMRGVFH